MTTRSKTSGRSQIINVPFHGDEVRVVPHDDKVWVEVPSVCKKLDLKPQRQIEKLKSYRWAELLTLEAADETGRRERLQCIQLDRLPMWLVTVKTSNLSEKAKNRLCAYQVGMRGCDSTPLGNSACR